MLNRLNIIAIGARRRGVSWSSYWASLISATVENAAPTHVVLTFPNAQTSLGAADFAIDGFTISSASWTDAVLTLVLSDAIMIFDGDLTITFVKTGETTIVTNNVADDGNTIAWYDSTDLTTITKDGSNVVTAVTDKLGSGKDFDTGSCGWDALEGFTFNGVDQYLQSSFAWDDPTKCAYLLLEQVSWTNNDSIHDGKALNTFKIQQINTTPNLRLYFSAYSSESADCTIGSYHVLKIINSYSGDDTFQVDENDPIVGNFGGTNLTGITWGATGTLSTYGNVNIKEAIYRKSIDDADLIMAYLKKKVT